MSGIMPYVALWDWLLLLSMMLSRVIHVVICISTSFLFTSFYFISFVHAGQSIQNCVYLFTSWWTFGLLHVLVVMKNVAVDMRVQVCVELWLHSCRVYTPRRGLLGHLVTLCNLLKELPGCFSKGWVRKLCRVFGFAISFDFLESYPVL